MIRVTDIIISKITCLGGFVMELIFDVLLCWLYGYVAGRLLKALSRKVCK